MESRQHREISRIPVAEIREIPWSHYDYVKSCFPPMPYVSLILQDISHAVCVGVCEQT
jgi:hypothetical protein